MLDEEILIKAIDKAREHGLTAEESKLDLADDSVNDIIFNLNFAKAFWGEEPIDIECYVCNALKPQLAYAYHLQQMVILNDAERMQYLERHLCKN